MRLYHKWMLCLGKDKWGVLIFRTNEEMNEWIAGLHPIQINRNKYLACCVELVKKHKPLKGFIVFSSEHIGVGVVAHEMTHAASNTLNYKNKKLTKRREEKLARITEQLCTMFWKKYYRYANQKN